MKVVQAWFLAGLSALVGVFAVPAQAALPEGVETAITAAGTDAGLIATAILVVIVGLLAFKLMRRQAH